MVGLRLINALVVLILVSFTSGDFAPMIDWLLVRENDGDTLNFITGTSGDKIALSTAADLNSLITCGSTKMESKPYSLVVDFSSFITSMTEWTVGVWAYFESTISQKVFQIGPISGKHYIFTSDTNGTIKVSYYKDASTTDPNNDFLITVPLNKWFFIAFNFVTSRGKIIFYVLVNGVDEFSQTSVGGSPVPFEMPNGLFDFGESVTAKFYEVLLTKSCTISEDTKTISLIDGADSFDIAIPCSDSCADVSCMSNGDCLALKQFCTSCTSGSCNTCDPDSGRENTDYCKSCVYGTTKLDGNCDLYLGCANTNNCAGCSAKKSTVCNLCPAGSFLFKQSETLTTSCTDSCSQCLPGPSCFECADSIVQDGSTCRVDKIGFQISFNNHNIVIDFANPLSTGLTENSFKATASDQTDIPTTSWTFTGCTAGLIQCTIGVPNVQESQLPISLDIAFAKA